MGRATTNLGRSFMEQRHPAGIEEALRRNLRGRPLQEEAGGTVGPLPPNQALWPRVLHRARLHSVDVYDDIVYNATGDGYGFVAPLEELNERVARLQDPTTMYVLLHKMFQAMFAGEGVRNNVDGGGETINNNDD